MRTRSVHAIDRIVCRLSGLSVRGRIGFDMEVLGTLLSLLVAVPALLVQQTVVRCNVYTVSDTDRVTVAIRWTPAVSQSMLRGGGLFSVTPHNYRSHTTNVVNECDAEISITSASFIHSLTFSMKLLFSFFLKVKLKVLYVLQRCLHESES